MRGELRKGNSGHNSVPKSARRTEPSPRNPRFAAHLRCVSAKEDKGSQEGTGNHTVSCPLLFPPVNTGTPRRRTAATLRALRYGTFRLQRRTAVSAEVVPSADSIKEKSSAEVFTKKHW